MRKLFPICEELKPSFAYVRCVWKCVWKICFDVFDVFGNVVGNMFSLNTFPNTFPNTLILPTTPIRLPSIHPPPFFLTSNAAAATTAADRCERIYRTHLSSLFHCLVGARRHGRNRRQGSTIVAGPPSPRELKQCRCRCR